MLRIGRNQYTQAQVIQSAKARHLELWAWLSRNPGKYKFHAPMWGNFFINEEDFTELTMYLAKRARESLCFACVVARLRWEIFTEVEHPKNVNVDSGICRYCPVVWPKGKHCKDSIYNKWQELNKKYDSIILEHPEKKETVDKVLHDLAWNIVTLEWR